MVIIPDVQARRSSSCGKHESGSLMSPVKTAYIQQLRTTSDGTSISKSEKLILFLLAYYHDDDSGESRVSIEDLAADSLHTETEVLGILQNLERKAMLEMIPHTEVLRIRWAAPRRSQRAWPRRRTSTRSLILG